MGITVATTIDTRWFGADGWFHEDDRDLTLLKDGSAVARFRDGAWAAFWTDEAETAEPN
jgi:hypothetical protein